MKRFLEFLRKVSLGRVGFYTLREIVPFFLLGNFFFVFLLLIERLVSLSDLFFSKNVPASLLLETIIYMLPALFFMTIPLSCLLATLLAFSRFSADSELIAMKCIGANTLTFIKPIALFSLVAMLINFSMGAYFIEKGSLLAFKNFTKIIESISINDIKENEMYTEIPSIILFVEKKVDNANFENVLLIEKKNNLIINSKAARIVPTTVRSFEMTFNNGSIIVETEKGDITKIGFERMALNMPLSNVTHKAITTVMTMGIGDLIKESSTNRSYQFELHKRFATPVSALIMAFFGYCLGIFLARGGRSFGILISIGVAFAYNATIVYFETEISTPILMHFPAWVLAWVPAIFFFILLLIFIRRATNK